MVIIRPTGDLAKRMKIKLMANEERSTTVLGDWFALDMVLERQQYILCVSERGRLPVVLKAAPYVDFPERLISELTEVLIEIGLPRDKVDREIAEMASVILAKTNNRSVLGSMNQFRFSLQTSAQLGRLEHDTREMSLWLADLISLILPDHTPKETVLKLFGEPVPLRPRRSQLSLVPPEE